MVMRTKTGDARVWRRSGQEREKREKDGGVAVM